MSYLPSCSKNEIGNVSKMMLLHSVNVYKKDNADKEFTMYCDPTYTSNEEDDHNGKWDIKSRHSWMEYVHSTTNAICLGQILAIILYSVEEEDGSSKLQLAFLMLRVEICQDRGLMPLPLYKYKKEEKDNKLYQIHPILHTGLLRPVFAVSALCQKDVSFERNSVESYSRFYVFGDEISKCSSIHAYEYYSDRMNMLRKRDKSFMKKKGSKCFHYNLYMSYEEMIALKADLDVSNKCVQKNKKNVDLCVDVGMHIPKNTSKKRKVHVDTVDSEDLDCSSNDDDDEYMEL